MTMPSRCIALVARDTMQPYAADLLQTFRPFPGLTHPHLQTLVAAKLTWSREPPSSTHLVELSDGDRIALEVSTPRRLAAPRRHSRARAWPVWLPPFAVYAASGPQALALWHTGHTHEFAWLWFRPRAGPLSVSQRTQCRCPGSAREPAAHHTAIASDTHRLFAGRQYRLKAGGGIVRGSA